MFLLTLILLQSPKSKTCKDALQTFLAGDTENADVANPNAVRGDFAEAHSSTSGSPTGTASEDKFKGVPKKQKFATLTDMTKRPSNEEEGQAFYAGGSERSGQQVLGPPKRKNFREQLTDMFRMAHEQNLAEPSPGPSSSQPNWGQGVRLGMTENDHTVVTALNKNKDGDKQPAVVLKLWSQGFSVNDGELRLYDDPENKEFLETVMQGEIPQELLQMGRMVNVDVEDHRHEDYKKTAAVQTFKGSGHTLGSPVPNIEGAESSPSVAGNPKNHSSDEKAAKDKLKVNTTAPVTTLQIRLADGTRLAAQFNLTHTVADIHQYIQNARPEYVNRNFVLISSFPTRELSDNTISIDVAGLKNASIMQRLV
ncbi:NSFL1 cofactor p47-like [Teleopsis dalmanni]|uniref:NSFL1 cofactor p47-like n=1 Tax=Teleopsis dalmanni TaxID=139649 RepID=UPI0018CEEFD3|nr:NSFL1 cofactor p47-like [Teleopsis dalmanni]